MRSTIAALILAVLTAGSARAGDFDYWLLALSWSPAWCATEARGPAEQCDPDRDLGFVLHGLWPQYEDGWPEHCTTAARDPSKRQTAAMADVMGSGGLAWHQWRKHGRCSGLAAKAYFDLARLAFTLTARPALAPRMSAEAIEDAFLDANPGLAPGHLVVTCRDGMVREVRLCLTRDLAPRDCGRDVERASCRARGALAIPAVP